MAVERSIGRNIRLNIDVGELPDEPDGLVALADRVNVACGGHAGDVGTMASVVARAQACGVLVGAHPSYVDWEGFGRRALNVSPAHLEVQVEQQCRALADVAARRGVSVAHMKPHGALYHAAAADPAVAEAVIAGALRALGNVAIIGPKIGQLRRVAELRGLPYLREGFADRGMRADGSLVPRGEPGALLGAAEAAAQAVRLAESGDFDTICVHGDGPDALDVARRVRASLEVVSLEVEPLGEEALRVRLPTGVDRAATLAALRALPGVRDVVLAEEHAAVILGGRSTVLIQELARAVVRGAAGGTPREHVLRARYDGPDLQRVASFAGVTSSEVVDRHASRIYTALYLGFLPGFAYLGDVDFVIAAPRLSTPRVRVPAGSVGIAGDRTAVYPSASPGGWNLIAQVEGDFAFDPERGSPILPGDRVRFVPT